LLKNIGKNMNSFKKNLLKKRYNAERRFQWYGKIAIGLALSFLAVFMFQIFSKGYSAFQKTWIVTEVHYDKELLLIDAESPSKDDLENADYYDVAYKAMTSLDPGLPEEEDRQLIQMVSYKYETEVKDLLLKNPDFLGKIVPIKLTASDDVDQVHKGNYPRDIPEKNRRVNDYQLQIYDMLNERGDILSEFNISFFTSPDSREAELAGIASSFMGTVFSILVCLAFSFPVAVLAAIYLEEFAPKNKFTDFIEVNINNLAAVPSIVFGLLGLGVLLAVFNLPRSTPLVGGITLSLMTLPTIIIAARASLKAVPPSIREAALAMGASNMQTTMHHTVPLSMPGTLSGTIIGLAQALGETAPLILIGMVAFVNTIPGTPVDPAASLPVQIYIWSESAERGFVEKVSACIMVLLAFLILMNLAAQIVRHKFEKKWS
jgi:phosphate transport system permease protein